MSTMLLATGLKTFTVVLVKCILDFLKHVEIGIARLALLQCGFWKMYLQITCVPHKILCYYTHLCLYITRACFPFL